MDRRRHVRPPRQYLPHRTDLMGDMLDAVDDHSRIVQKNDVAVFAHDLNDQFLLAQISQFIEMLDGDLDDSAPSPAGSPLWMRPLLMCLRSSMQKFGAVIGFALLSGTK